MFRTLLMAIFILPSFFYANSESPKQNEIIFAEGLILNTEKTDSSWQWRVKNSVYLVGPRDFNTIHSKYFFFEEKKSSASVKSSSELTLTIQEVSRIATYRYTITTDLNAVSQYDYVDYIDLGTQNAAVFVEKKGAGSSQEQFEKVPFEVKKTKLLKEIKRMLIFNVLVAKYSANSNQENYRNLKNKAWSLVGRNFRDFFKIYDK